MSEQQSPNPAEVYEHYFGPALFGPWARVLLEYAAPQSGERVLDMACGTGIVTRHVAPMVGAAGQVVGLDISPAMLAVARALPAPGGATIEWQEGNALRLGLPDAAFDLVLCHQGLQFFPDRAAAVREMRRVLSNGGRVALSVWQDLQHHPVFAAVYEATARRLNAPISAVALPFSFGDAEALRALLSAAGFQRIAITPQSLQANFPAPERFVHLTVLGSAATVPTFAQLDTAARATLVEAVTLESEATVHHYCEGDRLIFPMSTHIAVAYT
jgi:ubiquinone/menaquinone biosynthesis C-methylase UbiE